MKKTVFLKKAMIVCLATILTINSLTGCGKKPTEERLRWVPVKADMSWVDQYTEKNIPSIIEGGLSIEEMADIGYCRSDKYITLYDNRFYDQLFGDKINVDDLCNVIDSNKKLDEKYKTFFKSFFREMVDYYPDLELRVFAYNLKDVTVVESTAEDIAFQNNGSIAFYQHDRNTITIDKDKSLEDIDMKLTLRHELGHTGQEFRLETTDGWLVIHKYKVNSTANLGEITMEGMNVWFTVLPFMDEYVGMNNLGYPRVATVMKVIMDCIDYSAGRSASENIYSFWREADKIASDVMAAQEFSHSLDQIYTFTTEETQQNVPEYLEVLEQINRYTAAVYIRTQLNPSMSYSEVVEKREKLLDTLMILDEWRTKGLDGFNSEFDKFLTDNNIVE